ncbi:hypothetical protein Q644_00945 [Brucella intermedia 229E]|uniref:HTH LytTR-type domain-containing protein n=1 Tax=Brucella intermedia 229E TaxID=1337887 RepID=U4VER1_9HYPH|nr:hypothetical protein Q644_00945 [Brucella intermedia 229E]
MTLRRELESVPRNIADTPPPLLARLKPGNRGAILRLSAEDHYTRIVTSRGGEELLLLRFSDALNEVGNTSGLQIHRSHWVADRHVAELCKTNGESQPADEGRHAAAGQPRESEISPRTLWFGYNIHGESRIFVNAPPTFFEIKRFVGFRLSK